YRFDLFKSMRETKEYKAEEITHKVEPIEIELDKDLDLDLATDHTISLEYMKSRLIPNDRLDDIYYTDKFHRFVNSQLPNKFPPSLEDITEPRIVMPMRSYDNKIFGVIGRSLLKDAQSRYLTI